MDSLLERLAKRPAALAAAGVGGVAAVVLYRALKAGKQPADSPITDPDVQQLIDEIVRREDEIATHLSEAIQLKTVSFESPDGRAASLLGSVDDGGQQPTKRKGCACCGVDAPSASLADSVTTPTPEVLDQSRAAFLALHALLMSRYPRMHSVLERHVVNSYSLAYVWRGSQPALPPVGFAAHFDVVPVPDAAQWTHPPFAGVIADGCVWGRGAIDDKQSVIGLCEAVEALLARGFQPARTMVLLFGHDEELGGPDGAAAIARELPSLLAGGAAESAGKQETRLEWLLDEGLFLLTGLFPGVENPIAVVCTGEKGHLNVELSVAQPAGHSSVPGPTTAIGILAKAVTRIEASPFPAHLYPAEQMFSALLPYMPLFPHRLLFSNAWLTGPLLKRILLSNPRSAALLRTTTAVTMTSGGLKSNVLPPLATAIINHRIHPSESVASVMERDAAVIGDPRVRLTALEPLEPAPVSSTSSAGFQLIGQCVKAVFGSASNDSGASASLEPVVAPGTMLGNTDTKHYWGLSADIYRHCPTQLSMEQTAMFHGRDERITVRNLAKIAAFYASLMLVAGKGPGAAAQ